MPAALLVCEKFRRHLGPVLGKAGFRALLSRALALASAETAELRAVQVRADGSLVGLEELQAGSSSPKKAEGRVVLPAHLLGLLVAFIGETITVRLVREVWPDVALNNLDLNHGDKNEKR